MSKKRSAPIPFAIFVLLLAVAVTRVLPRELQKVTQARPKMSECTMEGFEASSEGWELVVLEKPFIVRDVRGCILAANNPLGQWPDLPAGAIRFQLKRSGSNKVAFETRADQVGRFEIEDVPEGRYCFLATVLGWKSVMGIVVVDKKAAEEWLVAFQTDVDH